jgi:hypothetical protein
MLASPSPGHLEDTAMALEHELDTFRTQLPILLTDPANQGKYALVAGDRVDSTWPTEEEALAAGYERFDGPFLVKQITAHEEPRYFSRNITRCR